MNPYILLALVIGWGASVAGAGWYGIGLGEDRIIAKQASEDKIRQETREAAQQGAANAIAQIKVVNTTVKGRVETIVRENTVYRDCKHDARSLRDINASITGDAAQPAGGGKLPEAGAAK